jgi:hypothetical protein
VIIVVDATPVSTVVPGFEAVLGLQRACQFARVDDATKKQPYGNDSYVEPPGFVDVMPIKKLVLEESAFPVVRATASKIGVVDARTKMPDGPGRKRPPPSAGRPFATVIAE